MRLCEFNVAVIPDPVEERTKGGLLLTADAQDREKHSAVRGTITHIAPRAFDEWPDGKPNVGEKVIFAKHSGMFLKVDGTEYRVLKDKDIVAVLE
jgi:chaperonin GroES